MAPLQLCFWEIFNLVGTFWSFAISKQGKWNRAGSRRHRVPRVVRAFLQRTDASAPPRWTCTSVGAPPDPRPAAPRPFAHQTSRPRGRPRHAPAPAMPRCASRACSGQLAHPRAGRLALDLVVHVVLHLKHIEPVDFFFSRTRRCRRALPRGCRRRQGVARHRSPPPAPSSAGQPSSPFPCSSLNPPHHRRAAPPRCHRPAGRRSGRTGAPRRWPAAAPFPGRFV
jgi:hypothetical protein